MEKTLKYAIVTGAASGMGRCYATLLAKRGYGIVAVDINQSALDSLCAEISAVPMIAICMDLRAHDAAQRIHQMCSERGAQVEVLVNNAGMLVTGNIADTAPERLQAIVDLHCSTPLMMCRYFVPDMIARGCGYVLDISSICAWMDWPIIGMYGNTKRFVKGFSRSLRVECRGTGVSVTTAVFGAVDTPLFNFPPKARRLMLASGVMISPQNAARKALDAMFKRRKQTIPGFVNRITIALCKTIPDRLLARLVRKYAHLFL